MSLILSRLVQDDLYACAKVYKLTFNDEDDYARLAFPPRLRHPYIRLEDRIQSSANKFAAQLQSSRCFGHKVIEEKAGEMHVVGFAMWMAPEEMSPQKEQASSDYNLTLRADNAMAPTLAAECDQVAASRFRALKKEAVQRQFATPAW
jgi:hypothetical protein